MNEIVIGFDAREMHLDSSSHWGEKRKEQFLFRPNVAKPLSVDTVIWPSVFEGYEADIEHERIGLQELWTDIYFLQRHLQEHHALKFTPCYLIAVTLATCSLTSQELYEFITTVPVPKHLLPNKNAWTFLGYDVADRWLLSGLANCGFLPEEDVTILKSKWGLFLNDFHLFSDGLQAENFKRFSNIRVSEHYPFFVFGIWLVTHYVNEVMPPKKREQAIA